MKHTYSKFEKSFFDGHTETERGVIFTVRQGMTECLFVAHKIARGQAITHLRTGYRVDSCTATESAPVTVSEAIEGFSLEFELNIRNLAKLEAGASKYKTVNDIGQPEPRPTPTPKAEPNQLSLF